MRWIGILFFKFLVFVSVLHVTVATDTYTAAVVEYVPYNYNSIEMEAMAIVAPDASQVARVKLLNLQRYEYFVQQAVLEGADIIVFPEDTTTGWPVGYDQGRDGALPWLEPIPALNTYPYRQNELESSATAVFHASRLAQTYQIAVVIDLGEVEWCQGSTRTGTPAHRPCPADGRWQFNTQLAFNASGALVGKHRKLHLFEADAEIFNYPAPSLDTFDVFGVRFGMLVCFDIWFQFPGYALAEQGVENFVMSSWWENNGTLPLISAVNMQQGFARASQSNLLACSVGVGVFDSGSGIYNGRSGLQNYVYDAVWGNREDRLIIQELSKSPAVSDASPRHEKSLTLDSLAYVRRLLARPSRHVQGGLVPQNLVPSIPQGEWISLPTGASTLAYGAPGVYELSHGSLQCRFELELNSTSSGDLQWVLMAYEGLYFGGQLDAMVCAVYQCAHFHTSKRPACQILTLHTDTALGVQYGGLTITAQGIPVNRTVVAMASRNQGQLLPAHDISVSQDATSSTMKIAPQESLLNAVLYAPNMRAMIPN